MLKKVLVANRGEIACRVIRACQSRGIQSVAVYSDADANAPHVKLADEAVHIGPSRSNQSYLDTQKILDAARRTNADAVHPGYGFLAENASFAEAVVDSSLVWIGPEPQSIRDMGDKQNARQLAIQAGVPVVPGTTGLDIDDPDRLKAKAQQIGYPLLIKAAAGGGGIGMRQVSDETKLLAAVQATHSQAQSAFGAGDVYLEKFVARARHIEVQIFGFGSRAIHAYERDCSLQRRFQKIIEEAPAPGLDDTTRQAMQKAAVDLAVSVNYQGAGTVEFILDVDTGDFYFLEMNTRIQVEHPITEMITGLDLVRMQLDYAGGVLQGMEQSDISSQGHSIECRLYAENPEKHFMPSPGTLTRYDFSHIEDKTIRVETGYEEGGEVTPFYDPLIAKIISYGSDRDSAIRSMEQALANIHIEGIKTNLNFLLACLRHPAFAAYDLTTDFVAEHQSDLLSMSVHPA